MQLGPPETPTSAAPSTGRAGRFVVGIRDAGRRNIMLAAGSIPAHLATASWKGTLLIVSPSFFMLGNVLFTVGLAAVKLIIVSSDRHSRRVGDPTALRRAYRLSGFVLLGSSLLFAGLCVPLLFGDGRTGAYPFEIAIAIATITFAELGISLHGFFSSRKRRDLMMEAVKISNIASALILLVLTQTALLSMASDMDPSRYNGICGVVMGILAALLSLRLILRKLPHEPRAPGQACSATADAVPVPIRMDDSRPRMAVDHGLHGGPPR